MKLKPASYITRLFVLLAISVVLTAHTTALGQQNPTTATKKDGRFSANIKDVGVSDPAGLMDKFDIGVQWWTLLGEAIEYYQVRWYSSGKYKIGDRWIYREKLEKYPDLLKRFDNLRPSKLSIKLRGSASGGVISVKRGYANNTPGYSRKGSPYKKDGQSYDRYYFGADFYYIVEDRKLLLTKSGKIGDGIVPGSPHWNEFIYWSSQDPYIDRGPGLGLEKRKKEDKSLEDRNKHLFKHAKEISVSAEKVHLEWPEYELRAIAETFDKYESGEEEPSPKEVVEERMEEEVDDLREYSGDDFWSNLEVVKEPKIVEFTNEKGRGIKYEGTNRIIVPAGNYYISKEGEYYATAFEKSERVEPYKRSDGLATPKSVHVGQGYERLYDKLGNVIVDQPFLYFSKTEHGYVLARVVRIWGKVGLGTNWRKTEIIEYDNEMNIVSQRFKET